MKAKDTEYLVYSISCPYLWIVNEKEFADINEYRLVLELKQTSSFWKKIVHEREDINKSEEHITPQDKVSRVVSINLNEATEGLLVKFTDDKRSGEMANALNNRVSI